MATAADFTTRTRDEMFAIYQAYQSIAGSVQDITDGSAPLVVLSASMARAVRTSRRRAMALCTLTWLRLYR